jgi:hypothetical protein
VERIDGTSMTVRMDGEKARTLAFDTSEMRHFDHGYAVTSHSSQGITTDRVLVNMDTTAHPELINTRFAYVSFSRASEDARIYTNDETTLAERLSADISKASAVEVARPNSETQTHQPQPKEQTMTNSKELTPRSKEGSSNRNLTILQSTRCGRPLKSTHGIMHRSTMRCRTMPLVTSGSGRPATSRATSTTRLAAGCVLTSKVSSTTAMPSPLRRSTL